MKKRWMDKLRSRAGESIAETLMALLISAIALTMLAGAVTSAMHSVDASKTAVNGYYKQANAMLRATADEGELTVSIETLVGKKAVVGYRKNDFFSGQPVIAYTFSQMEETGGGTP